MARENQRIRGQYYNNSRGDAKKQLMALPIEIVLDILLRLPAKSVGCIKCVSKTFLEMVNNISFSTLHTRLLIAPNCAAAADQVPRLLSCYWNSHLLSLQSLKYKDNTLTKGRHAITISSSAPCLRVRFVFCNVFGLESRNGDCMLVNPLGETGVLRLPESSFARVFGPKVFRSSWFGMGFDDNTNTYKVLCVTRETVHVLVLGTNSWRQISSLPPCELNRDNEVVCANGAVHWWAGELCDQILSFDFRREEFCLTPTPTTIHSSVVRLCTLRGCLAIIGTKGAGRSISSGTIMVEIWVLKDFDKKQWESYYNNKISGYSPPLWFLGPWGEWEHGIFCTSYDFFKTCVLFMDLRFGSINRVLCPIPKDKNHLRFLDIYSYPETLISLTDYGVLEDAHDVII